MNISSLSPSSFVLSWYGNRFALGGNAAEINRLACLLVNYDPSQAEIDDDACAFYASQGDFTPRYKVHRRKHLAPVLTHENFGYLVISEADIIKALSLLVEVEQRMRPETAPVGNPEIAARLFLAQIPKENFMTRIAGANNIFAGAVNLEAAVSAQSADVELDWLDTAAIEGVSKSQAETVVSHS